jgi:PadR family transcriptional regulator PadR
MMTGMKLTKDLVAASAAPLVLAILGAEGESYGYAIIQRVRELSGGRIEWTDGMLYPVLHRLEAQGAIAARWRESDAGRRRKYYTLRRAGRQAIAEQKQQWLAVHQTLAAAWGAAATAQG